MVPVRPLAFLVFFCCRTHTHERRKVTKTTTTLQRIIKIGASSRSVVPTTIPIPCRRQTNQAKAPVWTECRGCRLFARMYYRQPGNFDHQLTCLSVPLNQTARTDRCQYPHYQVDLSSKKKNPTADRRGEKTFEFAPPPQNDHSQYEEMNLHRRIATKL